MKKNKVISLLLVLISIISFSTLYVKAKELPLTNKIIYLDPGHGGIG